MINLIKLSVGSETVEAMTAWQARRVAQGPDGLPRHVTRMWPKRASEILAGGSMYWVVKGVIQARQPILRLDEVEGADGIMRCGIVLAPGPIAVVPTPKRPFQGWRYLKPEDAPADRDANAEADTPLPAEISLALAEIGVL
ncbi:lysophospholipase [Jannaschia pagri]|uniref:Lysophospholipase n=1 Tax=Jannaschia pagri TaxID=2829797 RepID=A0ABQ4NKS2_9RHOB|nr:MULTISPECIES: DUF1489 domain-containing protein [unclassified Jannaschia]GIT91185.1 lysophospholipase [Jannaschia sp. AI_61]GIT95017.1 lysophospholipase [Jannaschia sp. AI_62]